MEYVKKEEVLSKIGDNGRLESEKRQVKSQRYIYKGRESVDILKFY